MEFRILGPVEIGLEGARLQLGGPKQRAVLATLLLHPNRVVSVSRLIDVVWGEMPPRTARVQLQGHISALRQVFAAAGWDEETIETRSAGYLIRVRPKELDLDLFEERVRQAQRARAVGSYPEAAAGFASALGLWRGDALSDLPQEALPAELARLEERRLAVLEERIDADLAVGRHTDLVAELTGLANQHPLRERFHSQLMLAYYRSGRQSDALTVYRNARSTLVEELGLEPGTELQQLEQLVLSGEPVTEHPGPAPVVVPSQLPPDVADFTGRAEMLGRVQDQLTAGPKQSRQAIAITAVAGQAGVGKTTLAVHAAHSMLDQFPDGQLHVNLRGAGKSPGDPMWVLDHFLHGLGVDGTAVPDSLEDRMAMYRTRLASQRILVVLDNAADEAQVRPLLPGSPGCAVLITSRVRLAGLEGATLLDLDVLNQGEATELLARIAGHERVHTERAAAGQIVRLCKELPLAVRIAGARLAARPHLPLRRLVDVLSDRHRRLDELRIGDLAVRASLTLSYDGLNAEVRRAFRRFGLLDMPDFTCWVAAAVLNSSLAEAEPVVESLVDAQLLEVTGDAREGPSRYRMHDLLNVYARERAAAEDRCDDRHGAVRRALGGWLALADWAADAIQGTASWIDHGAAQRWCPDDACDESTFDDPLGWFEQERAALIAAIEQAAAGGWHEVAWDLANSLGLFLELRGGFADWRHTHQVALRASQRAGDHRGSAIMLRGLGEVHAYQDRYADALGCLEHAVAEFRRADDVGGEADTFCGFGLVYRLQGRLVEALQAFQRAATLLADVGDRPDRAYALLGVARSNLELGRLGQAEAPAAGALASFRTCGYRHGEAQALHNLGILRSHQCRLDEAVTCLRQALATFADLGEHHSNAYALLALGNVYTGQDRREVASNLFQQCLQTFAELGDPAGEARTSHSLGRVHADQGASDTAAGYFARSARIWADLGLPSRQATALQALGDAQDAAGQPDEAQRSRQQAQLLSIELSADDEPSNRTAP